MSKHYNLGYFLKVEHVEKGYKLLEKQIQERSYAFKSVDLELYRKEVSLDSFNVQEFYDSYIKQDLFYNYLDDFYSTKYSIPKGIIGVRNVGFLSFNLQVLYYSLGFYVLDLLKSSIVTSPSTISDTKRFSTYYGGKINGEKPEKSTLTYREDYKHFNDQVKITIKEIVKDPNKKAVVLKFDVQDFYDSISHDNFLFIIDKYAIPSDKKRLMFDDDTKTSIRELLYFIKSGSSGLPVTNQNIVSNFLSNIYLFDLDNLIREIEDTCKKQLSYFRYVDDFYIIFSEFVLTPNDIVGDHLLDISHRLTSRLKADLGLNINPQKSKQWIISNQEELDDFLNERKYISFDYLRKDNEECTPQEKFDEIHAVISELSYNYYKNGSIALMESDEATLKECFSKNLRHFLNSPYAINKLEDVFKNWNPILTLYSIKALIFMLSKTQSGMSAVENYISLYLKEYSSKALFTHLLEKFLLLENYSGSLDGVIIDYKNEAAAYYSLVRRMITAQPKNTSPKPTICFRDEDLAINDSLMQQLKKVVLAEKRQDYNLAFSHLLNCFHLFCYMKDDSEKKKDINSYKRPELVNALRDRLTFHDQHFIASFFDRRNKNSISHAGEATMENWAVVQIEYDDYKFKMQKLINRLFNEEAEANTKKLISEAEKILEGDTNQKDSSSPTIN